MSRRECRESEDGGEKCCSNAMTRRSDHVIYASVIAQPEVISAFQRKAREGQLDQDRARTLSQRVSTRFAHRYVLVAITPQVIARAVSCSNIIRCGHRMCSNWLARWPYVERCSRMGSLCLSLLLPMIVCW
jgi:hypothetical protein